MDQYYRRSNANIHRGIHTLAEEATAQYEDARRRIGAFVKRAPSAGNCVYPQHHRICQSGGEFVGAEQASGR
jgi:cysteine desulfurase/selenocysteine lyase